MFPSKLPLALYPVGNVTPLVPSLRVQDESIEYLTDGQPALCVAYQSARFAHQDVVRLRRDPSGYLDGIHYFDKYFRFLKLK